MDPRQKPRTTAIFATSRPHVCARLLQPVLVARLCLIAGTLLLEQRRPTPLRAQGTGQGLAGPGAGLGAGVRGTGQGKRIGGEVYGLNNVFDNCFKLRLLIIKSKNQSNTVKQSKTWLWAINACWQQGKVFTEHGAKQIGGSVI